MSCRTSQAKGVGKEGHRLTERSRPEGFKQNFLHLARDVAAICPRASDDLRERGRHTRVADVLGALPEKAYFAIERVYLGLPLQLRLKTCHKGSQGDRRR